jgi:erythromycin esterase-like protein
LFNANYTGGKFDGLAWNSKRDAYMAERLFWMMDNIYKGRKIILWGASGHFMKNSKLPIIREDTTFKWRYYQMGDYLTEKLKDNYYSMVFTSYQGVRGDVYPDKKKNDVYGFLDTLPQKAPGSFEAIAHRTGKPFLIVDLKTASRDHWLSKSFVAYPFGKNKDIIDWSKMVDAFFFIDTMSPDVKRQ